MYDTRTLARDTTIAHVDGEGDWLTVCAPAGDDDG